MQLIKSKQFLTFILFLGIFLLLSQSAFAAQVLPWDGPLEKIKNSLTGPVALAVSLIGIVVAGGMLIFGGELGEFARRIVMLVLVLSLLVAANKVLSAFYTGSNGALITTTSQKL